MDIRSTHIAIAWVLQDYYVNSTMPLGEFYNAIR